MRTRWQCFKLEFLQPPRTIFKIKRNKIKTLINNSSRLCLTFKPYLYLSTLTYIMKQETQRCKILPRMVTSYISIKSTNLLKKLKRLQYHMTLMTTLAAQITSTLVLRITTIHLTKKSIDKICQ